MLQLFNTVLFTALILGVLLLLVAPGRWWPRRPPRVPPPPDVAPATRITVADDDAPPYPRDLN